MNINTRKPNLVYCLTKADYFAQKTKEAITHAMGVIEVSVKLTGRVKLFLTHLAHDSTELC